MNLFIEKVVLSTLSLNSDQFAFGIQRRGDFDEPLYSSDRWLKAVRRQLGGKSLKRGQIVLVIFGSRLVQLSVDEITNSGATRPGTFVEAGIVSRKTQIEVWRCLRDRAESCISGYVDDVANLGCEVYNYFASKAHFEHLRVRPVQSILVCGVHGVGKSLIIKHALDRAGYPVVYGNLSAIITSACGTESAVEYIALALDDLVERARALTPSVLYIDRVDVLSDSELLSGHDELSKFTSHFANFADAIPPDMFLVLESSVDASELPLEIKRCGALQHIQTINVPTASRREQILKAVIVYLQSSPGASPSRCCAKLDNLCKRVATATPGYVARDIVRLCKQAFLLVLRNGKQSGGQPVCPDPVDNIADSMAQLLLTAHLPPSRCAEMEASALLPDWQHFASALQIVRPSQQLEFESVLPTKWWVDIGGYEAIKQALQRFIRLATLDAPLQLGIVPPSGVLLHGPSGCGKTALALAMIGESSCNVITIRGSELFSKYLGETEARLRRLFRTARAAAPCIVFMDEIDSIAAKREWSSVESGGPSLRVLSTLLNEMDGVHETRGVVTIGCTNQVDRIDDAILRPGRFDQLIEVRMPSPADRAGILQVLSGKSRLADDVSVSELVEKTDGFSGSDLEQLFREAGLSALRACCHAEILCKSDFASALDKLQTQRLNWLV